MNRDAIENFIDTDMLAAFKAMDQLDWRSHQGTYLELKEKWVDLPQGSSRSSFREQLKALLALHFSPQLQASFQETRLLTPPPFIPELFLGRDADLDQVYHKLFHEANLLLLVNGQGGIGKTTLAAKYWERYKSNYSHVAWVIAGDDLAQALLNLAPELALSFPEAMPNAERLPLLIQKLSGLNKPCLLIIDNANDQTELEKHYLALRSCANFHILLTSRITKFEQVALHAISPLEEQVAIELFQRHYPKYQSDEQALLLKILIAVGYNTLVIELLAQNLRNLNNLREQYSLAQLHEDLQNKGLLAMSKSSRINTEYHSKGGALNQAKPEEIISAMYELGDLAESEKQLLSVFAVLPAKRIELVALEQLLPSLYIDEPLSKLTLLGWLEFHEPSASLKMSPVIQHIIHKKQKTLRKDVQPLISSILTQLNRDGYNHYKDYKKAEVLSHYAISILTHFKKADREIAQLFERVGKYYEIVGNLNSALRFFQKHHELSSILGRTRNSPIYENFLAIANERLGDIYFVIGKFEDALEYYEAYHDLAQKLHDNHPSVPIYRNNLAISFSKLGDVFIAISNIFGESAIHKAFKFYLKDLELTKALCAQEPNNLKYQNNLAMSFSKIGETHRALGFNDGLAKASEYFNQAHDIFLVLKSQHPDNVDFQNGLAMSYRTLGDIQYALNETKKAIKEYELSYNILLELSMKYPDNLANQHRLSIALVKLGGIYKIEGDNIKALEYFLQELELTKSLQNLHPDLDYGYGLSKTYLQLSEIYENLGDSVKALEFSRYHKELGDFFVATPSNKVAYSFRSTILFSRIGEA